MALGPLVQLVGAGRADELGGGLPAEQAEVDGRGGRQGRALTGADRRHHHGGHVLPPREAQPVGQGVPGQVRVVDHHHQRAPLGQAGQHPDQRRVQHRGAEHAVGQDLLGPRVSRGPRPGRDLGGRAEQGGEGHRVPAQQVRGDVGPEPAQQRRQRSEQGIQRHGPVELPARGQQHLLAGRGPLGGPGAEQGGLPDPRLPVDDDELGRPGAGPSGDGVEVGQFVIPADQAGRVAGGLGRRRWHLPPQDGGVKGGGLRGRVRAELGGQALPGPSVGGQGGGHLAARDVGAQQDPQGLLVVTVGRQGGGRGVGGGHPVSGLEQHGSRHPPGPAGQPVQLGQPELSPFTGDRGQPVAAQQRERDPGRGRRAEHVPRAAPAVHLLGERGEFGRVEPVADQQVAAVAVLDPVPAQHRPEPADQHGQLILGLGGRRVAPQRVDQHVGRHHLALGQGQHAQRQPALPAAQGLRFDAVHAEVAQHPQRQGLHGAYQTAA